MIWSPVLRTVHFNTSSTVPHQDIWHGWELTGGGKKALPRTLAVHPQQVYQYQMVVAMQGRTLGNRPGFPGKGAGSSGPTVSCFLDASTKYGVRT